ncbi:class II glutamine amidotransferase [bacterium]|nr:class II glutamine amidotransferase [bacterium]
MCRMFGMVAATPQSIAPWLIDGEPSLRSLAIADKSGEGNPDGWGIGWYDTEDNAPHVIKEPEPANESPLYEQTAHAVSARVALAHVRRSSGTPRSPENTHPFVSGSWLFCHNGSCSGEHLKEHLQAEFRKSLAGDTDSELYFALLRQYLTSGGDPVEGIRAAVRTVIALGDFSGLNFLLSDGLRMYAFHYSTDPERHSMYLKHNEGSELVASEPLGSGSWEWLPNGWLAILTSTECTTVFLV